MNICLCDHCGEPVTMSDSKASLKLANNTLSGHLCRDCEVALIEWFGSAAKSVQVTFAKKASQKVKSGPRRRPSPLAEGGAA